MKVEIDFSKVTPIKKMFGETEEDTKQLHENLEEAKYYLNDFTWHGGIKKSYYGIGVSGIFTVFCSK